LALLVDVTAQPSRVEMSRRASVGAAAAAPPQTPDDDEDHTEDLESVFEREAHLHGQFLPERSSTSNRQRARAPLVDPQIRAARLLTNHRLL
jgi:hypothetical protein